MELKDKILECINDMTAAEFVDLYNEYQRTAGDGVLIYHMSQLPSIICYYDLFEDVKNSFNRCKFQPHDKFFIVSDHTVTSYYYIYDIEVDIYAIIDFIIRSRNGLGNIFIEEMLEEDAANV
jgi:hypothetical protein